MRALPLAPLALLVLLTFVSRAPALADCPGCLLGPGGGSGPNVRWTFSDSLAACPAGDTVVVNHPGHPHPSRLRIGIEYFDNSCQPRVGVPPDSIWVTWSTLSGNARVNDKGAKIVADDTTDACGFARITIPSVSGCGRLSFLVYVSGVSTGGPAITVRTADMNADGRVVSPDDYNASDCDLNYDGQHTSLDLSLVSAEAAHWHRHALHGTLARRTNLRNSGADQHNTIGEARSSGRPTAGGSPTARATRAQARLTARRLATRAGSSGCFPIRL